MISLPRAGGCPADSSFGAHRLAEHVFHAGSPDLLFVEFSVNDGDDREESVRGMEGIVRQCLQLNPHMDLIFIYTAADKNLTSYKSFNIAVHEEVAGYYGIPSVDCAAGVYDMIQAGGLDWRQCAPDGYHPLDEGHALYAAFVRGYLEQALLEGNSLGSMAADHFLLPPVPLVHCNYEYGGMLDCSSASYSPDFCIGELPSGEPLMNWRFSTVHAWTDDPAAGFSFEVTGQRAGLLLLCGPDTGSFEYSLNGGAFREVNLFDEWCPGAYRPVPFMFPVQAERALMRISIRNTGRRDSRSTGTGLRVLKLLYS